MAPNGLSSSMKWIHTAAAKRVNSTLRGNRPVWRATACGHDEMRPMMPRRTSTLPRSIPGRAILRDKRPDALRLLRLENYGPYVYAKFRAYGDNLGEYADSKAEKKRAATERRANRAASDLAIAVQLMKDRLETEERQGLLFYVEGQVFPPDRFTECVGVRVNYRWPPSIEDTWAHGSITFSHTVDLRPDCIWPVSYTHLPGSGRQSRQRFWRFSGPFPAGSVYVLHFA